jgi:hypothetical protein
MDEELIHALFPRIHAAVLGVAVGLTTGAVLFLLTALEVVLKPGMPIGLLRWYLLGYSVTWSGAFVGLAWGIVGGFAMGWLLGAVHNLTIGAWVQLLRARADLTRSRRLLDQFRGRP